MCPWYFLILSEHCQLIIKEKDPPKKPRHQYSSAPNKCFWLLDTYSSNYREFDKSRRDEKYYSRCNIELDNSRHNDNYYSCHNRELDNSLLRRDLLFSFLFLWWFFGELAILIEFSDENYWKFDENYWILSSNSVILVEISTRIAGFEERIQ